MAGHRLTRSKTRAADSNEALSQPQQQQVHVPAPDAAESSGAANAGGADVVGEGPATSPERTAQHPPSRSPTPPPRRIRSGHSRRQLSPSPARTPSPPPQSSAAPATGNPATPTPSNNSHRRDTFNGALPETPGSTQSNRDRRRLRRGWTPNTSTPRNRRRQDHDFTPASDGPVEDEEYNPFLSPQQSTPQTQPRSQSRVRFDLPAQSPFARRLANRTPRQGAARQQARRQAPRNQYPQPSAAPSGNRSGGHKSADDIHTFFEQNGNKKLNCKFCLHHRASGRKVKVTDYSLGCSTGPLRTHLMVHHADVWIKACDEFGIQITAKAAQPVVEDYRRRMAGGAPSDNKSKDEDGRIPFSLDNLADLLCELIVTSDQSFRFVENPKLRAILLMLKEELKDSDIPKRTFIRRRIIEMWEAHLKDLSDDMKAALGKTSFTMDMWTDLNLCPFMAVTAHWIQTKTEMTATGPHYTLILRSELVGFRKVPGSHDGEHLAQAFLGILARLDIDPAKIGWVTLDNAYNNDIYEEASQRASCFPHIVNLACQAILDAITNTVLARNSIDYNRTHVDTVDNPTISTVSFEEAFDNDPIATLRTLIRKIRASSLRREFFAEVLEAAGKKNLQLLRDVVTRWSSTYFMIERAIDLRDEIDDFIDEKCQDLEAFKLHENEWKALEEILKILQVPTAFQQRLSGEKNPTLSDALPLYESMRLKWENLQEEMPYARDVIESGLEKLDKYYTYALEQPVNYIATILNPAYKMSYFQNQMPECVREVKKIFLKELRCYWQGDASAGERPPQQERARTRGTTEWANDILGIAVQSTQQNHRSPEQEFDLYLTEELSTQPLLSYWEANQHKYPTIFRLALDYLPIQGSSVPCERVFSSAKETMTDRRSRLSPTAMEACQMLKFSWKKGHAPLDFTGGLSRDRQINELLTVMEAQSAVPEDRTEYIKYLAEEMDGLKELLETEESDGTEAGLPGHDGHDGKEAEGNVDNSNN